MRFNNIRKMGTGKQSREQLPYGVIFDMDGVLVDSEPFICRAACQMFAEQGLKVQPEDFVPFIGTGENRYIGGPAEKYGYELDIPKAKERTYDIYLEIIRGRCGRCRVCMHSSSDAGRRARRWQWPPAPTAAR
jgi:phosphoglycolate phosphatase-like HAD superfamily hydrolase